MRKHTTIAVDLSKNLFQIAVSRYPGRVCDRKLLNRAQLVPFFANRPAATVLRCDRRPDPPLIKPSRANPPGEPMT